MQNEKNAKNEGLTTVNQLHDVVAIQNVMEKIPDDVISSISVLEVIFLPSLFRYLLERRH